MVRSVTGLKCLVLGGEEEGENTMKMDMIKQKRTRQRSDEAVEKTRQWASSRTGNGRS